MKRVLVFILSFLCLASSAQGKEAIVIKVIDGDTIQIDDGLQRQIDIIGIDAPELNQPYGIIAAERLKSILPNRVYLDREHSRSADIILENGRNVAYDIVSEGMAWCNQKFNRDNPIESFHPLYNEALCQVEKNARKSGIGLWGLKNAIPPWTWRSNNMSEFSIDDIFELEIMKGETAEAEANIEREENVTMTEEFVRNSIYDNTPICDNFASAEPSHLLNRTERRLDEWDLDFNLATNHDYTFMPTSQVQNSTERRLDEWAAFW